MCVNYVALNPPHWGRHPQAGLQRLSCAIAWLVAMMHGAAAGPVTPTVPDAPPPAPRIAVPPATFLPSSDLDGLYLWLGPIGAASRVDARWDSTFGADAAVVIVHEQQPLSLYGVNLGASRWTARGGGRVWVDALLGTRAPGRMIGASVGPIVELSELAHPKLGGSI